MQILEDDKNIYIFHIYCISTGSVKVFHGTWAQMKTDTCNVKRLKPWKAIYARFQGIELKKQEQVARLDEFCVNYDNVKAVAKTNGGDGGL